MKEWQRLRLTENDLAKRFNGAAQNIGVLLGEPSGWLVDIDLDHAPCVERAPEFLPATPAIFGRAGKRRSHWIYRTTGPIETEKWRSDAGESLVELRATGCQTVFPPSVHPSGEPIEWEDVDAEPAIVDPVALRAAVNALADAVRNRDDVPGELRYARPDRMVDAPAGTEQEGALSALGRAKRYAAHWSGVAKGNRNDAAFKHAATLVRGFALTDADVLGILNDWNSRNDPPLDDHELRACVDSARKNGKEPFGAMLQRGFGPNRESRTRPFTALSRTAWPEPPAEAAYRGLPGRIVSLIEPNSEADPVAVLVQFLVSFGNCIGRGPHCRVEGTHHYTTINAVICGPTGDGRKGTSADRVAQLFRRVDEQWQTTRVAPGGLSSGEGLIWAVRDPIFTRAPIREKGRTVDYEQVEADPGEPDKRLLVIESEFGGALKVMAREGNTLSAVVRKAWDGADVLRTITKNSPARATGAHISIVGHITKDELLRHLDDTELLNGFGNRFLWIAAKRSKCLPYGGRLPAADLEALVAEIADAVEHARGVGELQHGDDARRLWCSKYPALSAGRPGLAGAAVSRAAPQVLRLAMLYALADRCSTVGGAHLESALALWDYAERSAAYIFGDALGDPVADRLLEALEQAPDGMTRNQLRELFGRNRRSGEIDRGLGVLMAAGRVRCERERGDGPGRPAERWFCVASGYAINAKNAVITPDDGITAFTAITAYPEHAHDDGPPLPEPDGDPDEVVSGWSDL